MTTLPVGIERRIGQRFAFNLPVALREVASGAEGLGFTQDLSSRGAFLFTEMTLVEGAEVELTLRMPSEITLGETMRVCCKGRVLRIAKPVETSECKSAEKKMGVAVCFSGYDYLPDAEDSSADFRRISALHSPSETDRPTVPVPITARAVVH